MRILKILILICGFLMLGDFLDLSSYAQIVPLPVNIVDFSFNGTITNLTQTEGASAVLVMTADQGDDAADVWKIQNTASGNALDFINDTTTVMSISTAGAINGVSLTLSANFVTTYMKLIPQASAPGSPASGMIYVDSTATPDELCFYDGAGWQGISSGTDNNCS